jgi:hypothetical protein
MAIIVHIYIYLNRQTTALPLKECFNTTFSHIVQVRCFAAKTGVPREYHRPATSHSHTLTHVISRTLCPLDHTWIVNKAVFLVIDRSQTRNFSSHSLQPGRLHSFKGRAVVCRLR